MIRWELRFDGLQRPRPPARAGDQADSEQAAVGAWLGWSLGWEQGQPWGRALQPRCGSRSGREIGAAEIACPSLLVAAKLGLPLGWRCGEGAQVDFEPMVKAESSTANVGQTPPFQCPCGNCQARPQFRLRRRAERGQRGVHAPLKLLSECCPAPRRSFNQGWSSFDIAAGQRGARGKGWPDKFSQPLAAKSTRSCMWCAGFR